MLGDVVIASLPLFLLFFLLDVRCASKMFQEFFSFDPSLLAVVAFCSFATSSVIAMAMRADEAVGLLQSMFGAVDPINIS
jgi:hypothetical protein